MARVAEFVLCDLELLLAFRLGLAWILPDWFRLVLLELVRCPVWRSVLPCVPVFLKSSRGPELSWSSLRYVRLMTHVVNRLPPIPGWLV